MSKKKRNKLAFEIYFLTKFNIDAVHAIQSEATQKSHKRSDNSHTRLNYENRKIKLISYVKFDRHEQLLLKCHLNLKINLRNRRDFFFE